MQIAYETMQFIVPNGHLMHHVSLSLGGTDPPFSFLVVVHVGLWVIIFVSDRVLQHLHHQSQAKGYLEFFRETKELRRIPYAILSIGTAVCVTTNFLMFIYFMRLSLWKGLKGNFYSEFCWWDLIINYMYSTWHYGRKSDIDNTTCDSWKTF